MGKGDLPPACIRFSGKIQVRPSPRITETPAAGSVEVWEICNLTGDTHPIHFHLVNVQIIQRAAFDAVTPTFTPIPGTERLPDPNELGWKETVRMNPGEVTTVIMKFDLPQVPFVVPPSPPAVQRLWHHRGRIRVALPPPGARGARYDAAPGGGVSPTSGAAAPDDKGALP